MTALYVFLCLTLFNTILLVCPVTVEAAFREEFFLRVGFLFFHYTLMPKKPEKKKAETEETGAKQPKKNRLAELYRAKGLSGFLKILGEAAKIAGGAAKKIFQHTVFAHFRLQIGVSGGDAAETAVNYGYACGAVGSATSLLLGHAKCKECRISVTPDFRSEQSSVDFEMKACVMTFFLFQAALHALFQSLKIIKAAKAAHTS